MELIIYLLIGCWIIGSVAEYFSIPGLQWTDVVDFAVYAHDAITK